MEVTILGSGSSGNATLLCTSQTIILIDAGLSARQLTSRLRECNVSPHELDGILITHEHSDHTASLKVLCKNHHIPIFGNPLTADALKFTSRFESPHWKLFTTGSTFTIKDLEISTFSVPHDASDPVGFILRTQTTRFGVLTDLGFATQSILTNILQLDGLLIETNYDEELLQKDTKRPWAVKQRIASRHGHLSNTAAAELVANAHSHRLRHVILGHLSRDCNAPDLALKTMHNRLSSLDLPIPRIFCASQDQISPRFQINQTEQ